MRDIDKGDLQRLLHPLELDLHLLAQLEVERAERLVEEQDARMVDERARDRHALLLAARQLVDVAAVVAGEVHQVEHLPHAGLALVFRQLFELEAELHVLEHVEVRKERVPLEDGVDLALVGRQVVDSHAIKKNVTGLGCDETANRPERRGLATAGRPKQGNEFFVADVEIQSDEDGVAIKIDGDVSQADNGAFFHLCIPLCGI